MVTLVMGLRGCGKSTWVREHLGENGLAYDMDAIASAFRLRGPHEEYHAEARHMANDLLHGWLDAVGRYADEVYVIRTAPGLDELSEIAPDRVVVCSVRYVNRGMDDPKAALRRIDAALNWCAHMGVPVEMA